MVTTQWWEWRKFGSAESWASSLFTPLHIKTLLRTHLEKITFNFDPVKSDRFCPSYSHYSALKDKILFFWFFSVKSPENRTKMGRSYEERVSSYRKTFGPEQMNATSRTTETRENISYRYKKKLYFFRNSLLAFFNRADNT